MKGDEQRGVSWIFENKGFFGKKYGVHLIDRAR